MSHTLLGSFAWLRMVLSLSFKAVGVVSRQELGRSFMLWLTPPDFTLCRDWMAAVSAVATLKWLQIKKKNRAIFKRYHTQTTSTQHHGHYSPNKTPIWKRNKKEEIKRKENYQENFRTEKKVGFFPSFLCRFLCFLLNYFSFSNEDAKNSLKMWFYTHPIELLASVFGFLFPYCFYTSSVLLTCSFYINIILLKSTFCKTPEL